MISNPEYLQDFALTQPSIQQLDQVQDESQSTLENLADKIRRNQDDLDTEQNRTQELEWEYNSLVDKLESLMKQLKDKQD